MPLAISSSSSMLVFWPSICHLSLSSPPCMSFSAAYFYFHPVSSASPPQLFPLHLVSFIVPPSMHRALYSKTVGKIQKKGSRRLLVSPLLTQLLLLFLSFCVVFLSASPACTSLLFPAHTQPYTQNFELIPWVFLLSVGGPLSLGVVERWLDGSPSLKPHHLRWHCLLLLTFPFFSHPTKDIQLADDYSAAVSLKVNSTRL